MRENFPNDATLNWHSRRYFPARMQVYVTLDLYSQQIVVGYLTCKCGEKVEGLWFSGLCEVQVRFYIISFNSCLLLIPYGIKFSGINIDDR